jgi:hypothetical protein
VASLTWYVKTRVYPSADPAGRFPASFHLRGQRVLAPNTGNVVSGAIGAKFFCRLG